MAIIGIYAGVAEKCEEDKTPTQVLNFLNWFSSEEYSPLDKNPTILELPVTVFFKFILVN